MAILIYCSSTVAAYIIFTLFFFFIALVFINLLNAYAVANVARIETKAENSIHINRVETVLFFEKFIQTGLRALGSCGRRWWVSKLILNSMFK